MKALFHWGNFGTFLRYDKCMILGPFMIPLLGFVSNKSILCIFLLLFIEQTM